LLPIGNGQNRIHFGGGGAEVVDCLLSGEQRHGRKSKNGNESKSRSRRRSKSRSRGTSRSRIGRIEVFHEQRFG
jgi:hypothetical protein